MLISCFRTMTGLIKKCTHLSHDKWERKRRKEELNTFDNKLLNERLFFSSDDYSKRSKTNKTKNKKKANGSHFIYYESSLKKHMTHSMNTFGYHPSRTWQVGEEIRKKEIFSFPKKKRTKRKNNNSPVSCVFAFIAVHNILFKISN
jgi:hypothetical protein